MKHARAGIALAALAGLAVAAWTFGAAGLAGVIAVSRRLGVGGFLFYCLYSLGVFVVLGGAWLAAAREQTASRLGRFTAARLIREAAADLLPFSQIGGLLFGARWLVCAGVPAATAYAALIVDLTTEMASQLIFTLYGVAATATMLAGDARAGAIAAPLLAAVAGLAAIIAALLAAQRWMLPLAGRIARQALPGSLLAGDDILAELGAIYARRRRVALSFALNLAAWIGSAAGAWIALRLMAVELPPWRVLTIESLIFTLRSAAFAVPAGIGVQEAGYALLGPLFGLSPGAALALALAKRARDLAIALPTLAIWQLGAVRTAWVTPDRAAAPRAGTPGD